MKPIQLRKQRRDLMTQNGIKPVYDSNDQYWIKSQYSSRKYRTSLTNCSCPDHKTGYVCKHILLLQEFLKPESVVKQLCLKCNSSQLVKNGTRKTINGKKQLWKCKECRYRFTIKDVREYKATMETIVKSMDLYMKGESYRSITNTLKQFHNTQVSQVSVMHWIKKYIAIMDDYLKEFKPEASRTWHADEQFIKVRNVQKYVWNCMDNETRFLLASHVSDKRDNRSATKMFKEAKRTADRKDVTIITDGAFSYNKTVKKEFWSYKNTKPHYRYVSLREKSDNNNIIERYHGTHKDRTKTMRSMKTLEGANLFNKGFKNYYNFIRPHETLEGRTPAQAGGLKVKASWKDIMQEAITRDLTVRRNDTET